MVPPTVSVCGKFQVIQLTVGTQKKTDTVTTTCLNNQYGALILENVLFVTYFVQLIALRNTEHPMCITNLLLHTSSTINACMQRIKQDNQLQTKQNNTPK
jgi:hypothetical protein